ncbi:MAG: membrane protein insertase YidC [Candidatus Pacebacteria bacterium]|nr:membrane protein insertase YidC [Candidatus Paceibacterota bacterium]
MSENRNLILAIILSLLIVVGYQFLYAMPKMQQEQEARDRAAIALLQQKPTGTTTAAPAAVGTGVAPLATAATAVSSATGMAAVAPTVRPILTRDKALAQSQRIKIDSPRIQGSISLTGGRLDDVTLPTYRQTVEANSPPVTLLSPRDSPEAYYTDTGWTSLDTKIELPNGETVWSSNGQVLKPGQDVELTWQNKTGQRFIRKFSIDANYMVTVTDLVENRGSAAITLYPYNLAVHSNIPPTTDFFILHEGFVGVADDKLVEHNYGDLKPEVPAIEQESRGGWTGLTDKYFLLALIPDQASRVKTGFRSSQVNDRQGYQIDWLGEGKLIAAGGSVSSTSRIFAGAKEVKTLETYQKTLGVQRFDYAVDWGWFFFLTRPYFVVLDWLVKLVGNFGVAILVMTVIIKGLFYPLANRAYIMQNKMKKLTPKIMEIREKYKEDKVKLNQEMMGIYKKEKVNPVSGCLPILIQIPIFFALYKVLFVTIEMRHAPFFGWIQDLSAADPTNVFTLFGLLPWTPPDWLPLWVQSSLHLGLWPIIMGVTMYVQQKMNPQPPDPIQAKIFAWMPIVITFMLSGFPAGLVIYWAWNNLLSVAQQWYIGRRMET